MMTPRQRDDYAAAVLAAVRGLQARYPGRIPGETVALLAEDLVGDGEDPADVRVAVAQLARAEVHYSEAAFRKHLGQAREQRRNAQAATTPKLAASNARSKLDARAGNVVACMIARAIWTDAVRFAKLAPEVLTARQNQLREQVLAAIEAEPTVTDAALMARFGRTTT